MLRSLIENVGTEIILLVIVALLSPRIKRIIKYIKQRRRDKRATPPPTPDPDPSAFLNYEVEKLDERILKVEQKKQELLDEINDRKLKDLSLSTQEKIIETQNLIAINKVIDELKFLKSGDIIDNQFILRETLGTGSMSVVWRAFDKVRGEDVSLKFLRTQFIQDQSVISQLEKSCKYMSENTLTHLANTFTGIRKVFINNEPKLIYYARQYIEGDYLEDFINNNPGHQEAIIEGLLKLGDDVHKLNMALNKGFILRKLTPSDIIVTHSKNNSELFLSIVDFDSILKKENTNKSNYFLSASEYVAPEVLYNKNTQSERSDVFTLGRIFCYVYYGKGLPNLYQKNAKELIDLLNCTPSIKKSLLRATSVLIDERYETVGEFLEDLKEAVDESKEKGFPLWGTLVQEEDKIFKILLHCFLGTLFFMSLARPLFTYYLGVHLSDRISVAIFHGIIGSLVWGIFIPGFFLFYLIIFREGSNSISEYLVSMIFCGIAGFVGGLLCAVPSLFVTNATTLHCLGWLTNNTDDLLRRINSAYYGTKMIMAFPLSGLFTGMGLGLGLNYLLQRAIDNQESENWFLPVPTKEDPKHNALLESLTFSLATHWKVYILLITPFFLNGVLLFVLNPSSPENLSICSVEPELTKRIIGEASVHLLGSFGLIIGFFYKMKTR